MVKECVLVVPCYNEAEVIETYITAMQEVMNNIKDVMLRVLFVNDGSKDRTLEKMKEITEKDVRFGYISFSRNFGKEAAMLAGIKEAYNLGTTYIGVMDVDMQDPPEMLYDMIEDMESGKYDCVAVKRMTRDGEPPARSFFARMFYKIMNSISHTNMEDGARDFRIMTREMVASILKVHDKCRFSKGIFGYVGYNIKWLPYRNAERAAGTTKWSFMKLLCYALDGITSFTEVPILAISLFVGGFGVLQFILYIAYIISCLRYGILNFFSIFGSEYLTRSIFSIFAAIMGVYMMYVTKEIKNRPGYFIQDKQMPVTQKVKTKMSAEDYVLK